MRSLSFACLFLLGFAVSTLIAAERPAAPATPEQIRKLIETLGAEDFFERERAQEELEAIGLDAFDLVAEATDNVDIEISHRAERILRNLKINWTTQEDAADIQKLMSMYDELDADGKLKILEFLAKSSDGRGAAALARIARFDPSPVVSKMAAISLVHLPLPAKEQAEKVATELKTIAGASVRPAVAWIKRYASELEGAPAGEGWDVFAEREEDVLKTSATETNPEIVVGLWRREFESLSQAGDNEKAGKALLRVVAAEPGAGDTLLKLIDWLEEHRLWHGIDEVAKRFARRIEDDATLLYAMAQARAVQGDKAAADAFAATAIGLHPKSHEHHQNMAYALQKQGRVDWAEAEYRLCLKIGNQGSDRIFDSRLLAEMLHDHARDLEAAEALEAIVPLTAELNRRGADTTRGADDGSPEVRAHIFRAAHYFKNKEFDKQIEHLRKAFAREPDNIDILIAAYHAPKADKEMLAKVKEKIREAAEKYQRDLRAGEYNELNNYAWLVANTEGDLQEALRASRKSLELNPQNGGYLDTLARCYYALGDYENAVKYQTEAVRFESGSSQIRRQLELFKTALADKQKKDAK